MIQRTSVSILDQLASTFKVVAITGPRQSGKTTLAQTVFSTKPYVSLEDPDVLAFARQDPRGFLGQFPDGAVIDEAQRFPPLFSYLQGIVDTAKKQGHFVLTGSQHFGLVEQITQSLAGRVGFLELLPLSYPELEAAHLTKKLSINELLYQGGYPPIHAEKAKPQQWYNAYITTYLERDLRQLIQVRNLGQFQQFLTLCASNIGQLTNTTRMGNDCGVTHNTVRSWLNILEASYIIFFLYSHHRNLRKRLVKQPKLYFHDTGLAARLLGIESPQQLTRHPLRGALFENWVILECLKGRLNHGQKSNLFFWRSHVGQEIDLLLEKSDHLIPIEIKSGATIASDWVTRLKDWQTLAGKMARTPYIIYGGNQEQQRSGIRILPWRAISQLIQ